jgi:hypothetical protein
MLTYIMIFPLLLWLSEPVGPCIPLSTVEYRIMESAISGVAYNVPAHICEINP